MRHGVAESNARSSKKLANMHTYTMHAVTYTQEAQSCAYTCTGDSIVTMVKYVIYQIVTSLFMYSLVV